MKIPMRNTLKRMVLFHSKLLNGTLDHLKLVKLPLKCVKTEIKDGNMRPDSTGLEKPVEVISATMISDNETETNIYWKPLNESQLDQALMCYINSQPTSTLESLTFQTHKQFQIPNCIDTMPIELTEINANNAFAQNNEYIVLKHF